MKKTYIVPATTRFDVKMQGMIATSNPPIDSDPDHAGCSNFLFFHQLVNVEAITFIRRNSSG